MPTPGRPSTRPRDAYGKAIEPLKAAKDKLPKFIEKDDPRIAERDAIETTMLDAMLQQGVADYELAETFPAGSPERAKSLKAALEQFQALHKSHREQWAGLTARMWEGKVFEEQGEIGPAVAIYKELMGHTDLRLRRLQSHVGYFLHRRARQAQTIPAGGRRGRAVDQVL